MNLEATEDIQNELIEIEMLQKVYEAVESLPPKCREVFKMLYVEGLSYKDVSARLDLSVQTVRNHKSYAVNLLRHRLAGPARLLGSVWFAACLSGILPLSHLSLVNH